MQVGNLSIWIFVDEWLNYPFEGNSLDILGRRYKMKEKIEAVLNQIRPNLARDGGNVELVDATDGMSYTSDEFSSLFATKRE